VALSRNVSEKQAFEMLMTAISSTPTPPALWLVNRVVPAGELDAP